MHPFDVLGPVVGILACLATGVFAVVLNFCGAKIAEYLCTMIFLDTVGTAIMAFICGPWAAALVGLVTNLAIGAVLFRGYLHFWPVNVVCGIAWGFSSYRLAATSPDTIILFMLAVGVGVGVLSAVLSVPLRIILIALNKKTDHILDKIVEQLKNKTRKIGLSGLPKEMFVRRLSQEEAKKLLAKFE